jgi:hypothetical protein
MTSSAVAPQTATRATLPFGTVKTINQILAQQGLSP